MNDLNWLLENGWSLVGRQYRHEVSSPIIVGGKQQHNATFNLRLKREIEIKVVITTREESEIENMFAILRSN